MYRFYLFCRLYKVCPSRVYIAVYGRSRALLLYAELYDTLVAQVSALMDIWYIKRAVELVCIYTHGDRGFRVTVCVCVCPKIHFLSRGNNIL